MKRLIGALVVILAAAAAVLASNWSEQAAHPVEPLPGLVVVAAAPPEAAGYDRECGRGHRCVFGPKWTDDVDVAGGHDGCDTRNGILRAQLRDVVIRPGTRGCVVAGGTLTDPYSGEVVTTLDRVQIDHVFPLAQAWSRGANGWTLQRRKNFANDPRNLLAVTSKVNRAKSDKMPDQWAPPTAAGRCAYASRFVEVADAYQLTITTAEHVALIKLQHDCPKK